MYYAISLHMFRTDDDVSRVNAPLYSSWCNAHRTSHDTTNPDRKIVCYVGSTTQRDKLRTLQQISSTVQFRPLIALCTDLSRVTTELWEIPVFSPADGALIFTYDYMALLFGVMFFPS